MGSERGLLRVVADRAETRRRVVEAQPYRDAEDLSYPSEQNRFESYQWITNRFIEQLNRGLVSLRSPFELRIARAQAVLSATVEIVRLRLLAEILSLATFNDAGLRNWMRFARFKPPLLRYFE